MDFYLDPENCYQRLEDEFKKYGKLIFCVDFDDTLYDFHNVGRTYGDVMALLKVWEDYSEVVIFTIVTDGAENSSKEFDWETVRNMIKHQREKYSWVFTFLGANIDVDRVSDNLGIDKMLSKRYTASKIGTQKVFNATSKSLSFARGVSVDSLDSAQSVCFMSSVLDEVEDKK